jgi:signal transduction histidine kinase
MVARDGKTRSVGVTTHNISLGSLDGRAAFWRDVTPYKKLMADLATAQVLASVGELAAAVAHEVKNPLAGISGAMQVLKDAVPKEDSRAGVIDQVQLQVERLDRLIRELLSFARPWTIQRAPLDLCALSKDIIRGTRNHPRARHAMVEIRSDRPCTGSFDRELVETALANVVYNSIEAVPEGGHVTIACECERGMGRLIIEDDGPGIPKDNLEQIFKPFFTTKARGTGLGLSIVKRVTDALGGTVTVASEPGEGTRVTLEFPKGE